MITIIAYLLLNHYVGSDFTGWLLVLPVLLDIALIDKI